PRPPASCLRKGGTGCDPGATARDRGRPAAGDSPGQRRSAPFAEAQWGHPYRWRCAAARDRGISVGAREDSRARGSRSPELRGRRNRDGARQLAGNPAGTALHHMSTAHGPESRLAILLGGGVREALMAQPLLRACEGASVFTSGDALGTLLGLPSVGRAFVFDDSPGELLRLFRRLRAGPISTVVVPFPARFLHLALAYFAGVPRR